MDLWIIASIIVSLLIISGIAVTMAIAKQGPEIIDCENCEGNCNQERNCGRASCGAIQGRSCGCS